VPTRLKKKKSSNKARIIGDRNRLILAYMELVKDKLFKKLDENRKMNLVQEVLAVGDDIATGVVDEFGTRDPRKIAAKLGVRVFGEDQGRHRRAEYRDAKKEIVIYREFHEKLLREVHSKELSEHLLKFIVAHELFSYLELNRVGEIYKRYKFEAWKIGPLRRQKFIKGLSRVAAQAFTQSLLGLEVSPQVFDYLTYILFTNN